LITAVLFFNYYNLNDILKEYFDILIFCKLLLNNIFLSIIDIKN